MRPSRDNKPTHPLTSLRVVLAWIHLLALGIGLGAVGARAAAARRLSRNPTDADLRSRVLGPDNWWGIAAVLWLLTGLWRLFGSTEKSTAYYLANDIFYAKMGMFLAVLMVELWPMITLIRWRMRKAQPSAETAKRIAVISYVEAALIAAIALAAVSMARGLGAR